ncbi:MAG: response regulator [Candidatus Dadabacteria bacterium]|nr:MAG: response regulator [Candidatus Dadabacteria bacterium]
MGEETKEKKVEGKILVVEDDDDSRYALCMILKALGYEPLDFGSPEEALEGVKGETIALAMLDIMMPNMNGYELMTKLKELPNCKDVPVIMVTAKDEYEEILEGYNTGVDYYITKPFTSKQIEYGLKLFLD